MVTGASRGIGAVYADRLAKRGYDLILVSRSEAPLKALSARLASASRTPHHRARGGPQQQDRSRESGNKAEGRFEYHDARQQRRCRLRRASA